MNKADDILGNTNKSQKSYNRYNNNWQKNTWQERQNKDRAEAYDTMEKMSFVIRSNGDKFKQYLDIQSRFPKHSVGNCFIVQAKEPDATLFRDKEGWKKNGVDLIANAKGFKILEPNESEKTGKIYYNPKVVYDISQTKAEDTSKAVEYSDRELLLAFIHNCFADVKVVNKLPDESIGAKYDKQSNILYVCRGMEKNLLFQTLSQELANIEMRKEDESDFKDFKTYCISYLLCKRYGIDVSDYNFDRLPSEIRSQTESQEIRRQLNSIRVDFEKINERVTEHFENNNKEKKKEKVQER